MKLYIMPGACSLASHIALVWVGAQHKIVKLTHDSVASYDYRRINPKGAVPTLILNNETVITESLAILEYIADTHTAARLGAETTVERAKLNECLAELVSDVHKAWAPVFAPRRFVTKEANQEDAREAAYAQLDIRYARFDELMRDREWLLFGRRTVADAYLYVMCRWKDKTPAPLPRYPNLNRFKRRLDVDLGVQRALDEESKS